MNRTCDECGASYDDAQCWTICPHQPLMSDDDLAQKDLGAHVLRMGRVVFAHHADDPFAPTFTPAAMRWDGMIELRELSGWFAPHLFVEPRGAQCL